MPGSSPKSKKQLEKGENASRPLDELPPEISEKLSGLPEDAREAVLAFGVRSEVFRGPFPHPKHVAEYERFCPGILGRIVTMAEKEQAANIANSHKQLENGGLALQNQGARDRLDSRDTARGQYLGFFALMALVAAALISLYLGHEYIAGIFFSAGVMLVIGKFLIGKFSADRYKDKG